MISSFMTSFGDLRIKTRGKTIEEAFAKTALKLTQAQVKIEKLNTDQEEPISIKADNKEELLYQFLSQLIFLKDEKRFLGKKFKIKIKENQLKGEAVGSTIPQDPQALKVDAKAVTWHDLKVAFAKKEWEVEVIVDI